MKSILMPHIAAALSSDSVKETKRRLSELRRRIKQSPHVLHVFVRIDDPYSYLLIQVLRDFIARFDIEIDYHTTLDIQNDMYPKLEMWHEHASYDAAQLAKLYQLDFTEKPPLKDLQLIEQATATLLAAENRSDYLNVAEKTFKQVWENQTPILPESTSTLPAPHSGSTLQFRLIQNEKLLKKMGHYLSATIYYAGEWYWGLDRLDHLEQRLIDLGVAKSLNDTVRFNRTYKGFCASLPNYSEQYGSKPNNDKPNPNPNKQKIKPLTLYWSARSPYSYLGLERAVLLAKHYNITLDIKPVLPMMMRDMNVPQMKKMYIFLDTKREATKLGIPYGKVADPLGEAVMRCYALFDYAKRENKRDAFLLSFARGVNSEGIRAETDTGMKKLVVRAGLDWNIAKPLLTGDSWKAWVNSNLDEMYALGCWGVPSFHYGDRHYWGQDRIGLLEQDILADLSTAKVYLP